MPIASTAIETGATTDKDLSLVDVYKKVTAAPVNTLTSTVSDVFNTTKDAVTTGVSEFFDEKNVLKMVDDIKADKPLTLPDSVRQLQDIGTSAISVLKGLEDLKTPLLTNLLAETGLTGKPAELAKGLLGLPGSTSPINTLLNEHPNMKTIYGAYETVKHADVSNGKGIMSLLTNLTGNSELGKVINMEGQFSTIRTVMANVKTLGNMAKDAYASIKGAIGEAQKEVLITIARSALLSGNIDLLNAFLNDFPGHRIISEVKDAVKLFLMSYEMTSGETETTELVRLVNVLEKLDIHWDKYNRGGTWIFNLDVFITMSDDAHRILKLGIQHHIPLRIADSYHSVNLKEKAKEDFPNSRVNTGHSAKSDKHKTAIPKKRKK